MSWVFWSVSADNYLSYIILNQLWIRIPIYNIASNTLRWVRTALSCPSKLTKTCCWNFVISKKNKKQTHYEYHHGTEVHRRWWQRVAYIHQDAQVGWKAITNDPHRHLGGGVSQYDYVESLLIRLGGHAWRCLDTVLAKWDYKKDSNPNILNAICEILIFSYGYSLASAKSHLEHSHSWLGIDHLEVLAYLW